MAPQSVVPLPVLFLFLSTMAGQTCAYGPAGIGSAGFIYRCPMSQFGFVSPYAVSYCGTGSLFHYYVCCDYNPTECCFQLEAWVIVALVVIGLLTLLGCIGCCLVCFVMQRR